MATCATVAGNAGKGTGFPKAGRVACMAGFVDKASCFARMGEFVVTGSCFACIVRIGWLAIMERYVAKEG